MKSFSPQDNVFQERRYDKHVRTGALGFTHNKLLLVGHKTFWLPDANTHIPHSVPLLLNSIIMLLAKSRTPSSGSSLARRPGKFNPFFAAGKHEGPRAE